MATLNENELRSFSSRRNLNELAEIEGLPCISILMPTHRAGSQTRENAIRFSNLIKQAEGILEDRDLETSLLAPLRDKQNDSTFWQHQGDGLAIFFTAEQLHQIRLNYSVDEQVVIDNCFYLKPLVNSLESNSYYFLALTWEQARLFEIVCGEWRLIDNDRFPVSYDQLILPRDPEDQLQGRSFQSVGNTPSSNTAMFHGHGGGEDKIEGDRRNYIARVADLVEKEVYNSSYPLVLASTEEVAGTLSAAAQFKITQTISESPANYSDAELEQKFSTTAADLIRTSEQERIAEFGNRFGTAMNQNLASDQIDDVLVAALRGQIDALMINTGASIRGVVSKDTQSVSIDDSDAATDLVNVCVLEALKTGAKVYSAPAERMPGKSQVVAAIYRF